MGLDASRLTLVLPPASLSPDLCSPPLLGNRQRSPGGRAARRDWKDQLRRVNFSVLRGSHLTALLRDGTDCQNLR